jgi:hypothetical protein
MKRKSNVVMQSINKQKDADYFQEGLDGLLEKGGEVISSGVVMHGLTPVAWAFILTPELTPEQSKDETEAWDWLEQKVLKRYKEESRNDFGLSEVEHAWQMALDYVQEARSRAGR